MRDADCCGVVYWSLRHVVEDEKKNKSMVMVMDDGGVCTERIEKMKFSSSSVGEWITW